ncbi:MAG TPA: hypothetical protein VE915_02305 [Actinomycetota bacterium]|jgi:uncharacterized paraquat-inducible protein A|nr:hypothetical protein [Actinomycetota bacterium]
MTRCPSCGSARVVHIVDGTRRAFCTRCGTRWRQEADRQWAIRRPTVDPGGGSGFIQEPRGSA